MTAPHDAAFAQHAAALEAVLLRAQQWFAGPIGAPAREYLCATRAIPPAIAAMQGIGCLPPDRRMVTNVLQGTPHAHVLRELGLLPRRAGAEPTKPAAGGWVVIPLREATTGRLAALKFRAVPAWCDPDVQRFDATAGFAGVVYFGLDAIPTDAPALILVEGEIDAMALMAARAAAPDPSVLPWPVAARTARVPDALRQALVARGLPLHFALDLDAAGWPGMVSSMRRLEADGIPCTAVAWPSSAADGKCDVAKRLELLRDPRALADIWLAAPLIGAMQVTASWVQSWPGSAHDVPAAARALLETWNALPPHRRQVPDARAALALTGVPMRCIAPARATGLTPVAGRAIATMDAGATHAAA